jgi:hypothetical protein
MKRLLFFTFVIASLLISCDDTTDGLGGSLTDISDNVEFFTREVYVPTSTVNGKDIVDISARSSFTYLGRMFDKETKSYVRADFMTQVVPLSNTYLNAYNAARLFPGLDSIVVYNDKGEMLPNGKDLPREVLDEKLKYLKADSCYLTFYVSGFEGDSLAQMSVNVMELDEPYEESEEYSINFDPEEHLMLRTKDDGSMVDGAVNEIRTFSIKNMVAEGRTNTSRHYVTIPLNSKYKGQDDVEYPNYGTYLMKQYLDPSAQFHNGFNNQVSFLDAVCPGFYLKHIAGEGAMAKVSATSLNVFYSMWSSATESKYSVAAVFSGTEESIQHSLLSDSKNEKLVEEANASDTYSFLRSPNGIFTELTIDVDAIMKDHESDSLSTVRLFMPSINDKTEGKYNFDVPETVLMVCTDSIGKFFTENKIANARTSFLANFSYSTNGYTFGNISKLITDMYKKWKASGKSIEDYSSDPETRNWNKVLIVPVETSYSSVSSTTTLTKVSHSMAYSSTRMRRGVKKSADDGISDDKGIKLSVIYSRYKTR